MIQNKNIQIDSIETKMASTGNTKYILISGKEKFQFWQTQKGGDSNVYLAFTGMKPRKGDTVHIGYLEEEKEFTNDKGENVKYTEKTIVGLREAGQGDVPAPSAPRTAPRASQSITQPSTEFTESREAFGRRLAIHGMVNGMLASGERPAGVKLALNQLFILEDEIERQLRGEEPLPEELPQDNDMLDDLNASPF